MGFVGAFGVIIALGLWHLLGRLSAVLTLIVVAFFLTLALDPIVQFLTRRDIKRPAAVAIVFAGVLVVFTLLGLLVVPPVIQQGTEARAGGAGLRRQRPTAGSCARSTRTTRSSTRSPRSSTSG